MKTNYRASRHRDRRNEPSAERRIDGTDWLLQVFEGYDQRLEQAYYHFRLLRTSPDGSRTYSTVRPMHLISMVTALAVACRGASNLSAIDSSLREQLAVVAEHLARIPLPPLNDGRWTSKPDYMNGEVNAIDNAFGLAS